MNGIIKNGWKASAVCQRPFQVVGFYLSLEEDQQYLLAYCEYAEWFFTGNDLEEEKGEGNVDEIYCIESVNKGDQDQDGNASEIFDDENIYLDEETLLCSFIFRQ